MTAVTMHHFSGLSAPFVRSKGTVSGGVFTRLNGKQIGRKKDAKITTKKSIAAKEIIRKHSRDFSGTLSDVEVMQLTGLSRNTYYKYKRELKA